jgi:predicted P-loop ATPase
MEAESVTNAEILARVQSLGLKAFTWPAVGDSKGPREKGWPQKVLNNTEPVAWKEDHRVGILLGTECSPGKFVADIDIDWAPGAPIVARLMPPTGFVFGRASKPLSHAFYTVPEPLPSIKFTDPTDKVTLLEFRCAETDGTPGLQTMVPPSTWSKEGVSEPLSFIQGRIDTPAHFDNSDEVLRFVKIAAVGVLIAKRLGRHGFGHETRLAWAGALLRLGATIEELQAMGEAISVYCENTEIQDIAIVLSTTDKALRAGRKAKGGPALVSFMGEGGKAALTRIAEWLGKDEDFARNDHGKPIAEHQDNIRRALDLMKIRPRHDEFAERVVLVAEDEDESERLLDDASLEDLWLRVDKEFGFRPTFDFFARVVRVMAREDPRHPPREWFAELEWDKTPRLDTWLIRLAEAEDTPYIRAVSALPLIAAVRRVRQPGAKYDEMLVLESKQGYDKSSSIRALCPKDDWFSDDLPLNVDSKQIIERTVGKLLIEASDLAGKSKSDIEQLKATMSRQVDGPARLAYARMPTERRRQFVLIGTTNNRNYLTDSTGSRRFWPVEVKVFNLKGIKAERDQLWAEAAYREAQGESIRLDKELWPLAAIEQEARRTVDAWEDEIEQLIQRTPPGKDGRRRISSKEVWNALQLPVERRDRRASLRVSDILHRSNFRAGKMRPVGEELQSGYVEEL